MKNVARVANQKEVLLPPFVTSSPILNEMAALTQARAVFTQLVRARSARSVRTNAAQPVVSALFGFGAKKHAAVTLPALPYDLAALEPVISANTLAVHHGKHHQVRHRPPRPDCPHRVVGGGSWAHWYRGRDW